MAGPAADKANECQWLCNHITCPFLHHHRTLKVCCKAPYKLCEQVLRWCCGVEFVAGRKGNKEKKVKEPKHVPFLCRSTH
eukprot:scaffold25644_cov19-Tisochrysis_lutea.AAC.1